MSELFKGNDPVKSCYECKRYAGEHPYPHCAKFNQATSAARKLNSGCFEIKTKKPSK